MVYEVEDNFHFYNWYSTCPSTCHSLYSTELAFSLINSLYVHIPFHDSNSLPSYILAPVTILITHYYHFTYSQYSFRLIHILALSIALCSILHPKLLSELIFLLPDNYLLVQVLWREILSISIYLKNIYFSFNLEVYFVRYRILGLPLWLSWSRICLQCGRSGFDLWVGKNPWRRERLLTPVFWSGEFHGLYSPCGCKESDMTERLSLL